MSISATLFTASKASFVVVCALACLAPSATAATIYVNGIAGDDTWDGLCEEWDGSDCGPKATIQAGIDAASDGDEVVVADGIYTGAGNKNLDFAGRAITVRSASGDPDTCIIDCEGDGRGFYFHSWETAASVVGGFTITNGYTSGFGGGIRCESSHPTITNCTVTYNGAYDGGGIYCQSNSSPTITGCTITENTAANNGGGIGSKQGCSPTINGCTITQNTAGNAGGGMHCDQGDPMLINCVIMDNTAMWGGGFHCSYYADPTITNSVIVENAATWGGGIDCYQYCSPTITNCTITANRATVGYGGAVKTHNSNLTIANCILWANIPNEIHVYSTYPVLTYCDIEGGWTGDGNIDADPLFGDGCHLTNGSPCIDAADNGAVPADALDLDGDGDVDEPIPFDLDGNPRFVDDPETDDTGIGTPPIVDMGAFEFQSPFILGDLNCDGLVDFFDIDPFVLAIMWESEYLAQYPDCGIMLADCNGDGTLDFFDIDCFVGIITGG